LEVLGFIPGEGSTEQGKPLESSIGVFDAGIDKHV